MNEDKDKKFEKKMDKSTIIMAAILISLAIGYFIGMMVYDDSDSDTRRAEAAISLAEQCTENFDKLLFASNEMLDRLMYLTATASVYEDNLNMNASELNRFNPTIDARYTAIKAQLETN